MTPCRNVEALRRNWEQVRAGAREFPLPSSVSPPSPPRANGRAAAAGAASGSPAANNRRREAAPHGAGLGAGPWAEPAPASGALDASWAALEALRGRGARRSPTSPDPSPPRGPRGLARALASGILRTVGRSAGPTAREPHTRGCGGDRGIPGLRRGDYGAELARSAVPAWQVAPPRTGLNDVRQQRPPAGQARVNTRHGSAGAWPARPAANAGFSMGHAALDPGVWAGAVASGVPGVAAAPQGHGPPVPPAMWGAGAGEPQARSPGAAGAKRQRLGQESGRPQRIAPDADPAALAAPSVLVGKAKTHVEQARGLTADASGQARGLMADASEQAAGAARQLNGAPPPWRQPGSAGSAPSAAAVHFARRAGPVPTAAAPHPAASQKVPQRGVSRGDYWARHGLPTPPLLHGMGADSAAVLGTVPARPPASAGAASPAAPPAAGASAGLVPPPQPGGLPRSAQVNGAQPSGAPSGITAASSALQGPAGAAPLVWGKAAAAAAVKARLKPILAAGGVSRERFKAVARAATHALAQVPLADGAAREAEVAQAVEAALRDS